MSLCYSTDLNIISPKQQNEKFQQTLPTIVTDYCTIIINDVQYQLFEVKFHIYFNLALIYNISCRLLY